MSVGGSVAMMETFLQPITRLLHERISAYYLCAAEHTLTCIIHGSYEHT